MGLGFSLEAVKEFIYKAAPKDCPPLRKKIYVLGFFISHCPFD